jgi:hypothetical protein
LSEDETICESHWKDRVATQRAEFTFVVKEGGEGQLSVTAEPLSKLKGLTGLIQLELKDGTTMAEAHEAHAAMRLQHRRDGISLSIQPVNKHERRETLHESFESCVHPRLRIIPLKIRRLSATQ